MLTVRIRAVAVSERTLRRQFDARVLERLALIALGRVAGFSLDEIALMFAPDGRPRIDRQPGMMPIGAGCECAPRRDDERHLGLEDVKRRILEVYANVAEFGDGVYGAQAAARSFFGRDASALGAGQSARLAAVLPSPRRYSAASPGPYVQRRTQAIERNMRQIGGTSYLEALE